MAMFAGSALAQTIVDIDRPVSQVAYSGTQFWGGWAIDHNAPITAVTIDVDNVFYTQATIGVYRPDVCNAVGNWPGCPYVGYDYSFNTQQFGNGTHTLTVTATTSDNRVASENMTFSVSNNSSGQTNTGCGSGPTSSCLDPIPATYLSGSWIEDDSASEWTLTANNGTPGGSGSVSGSVMVFPPPQNCPVVNYTASGSFSPSAITPGTGGYTTFNWVATNPNPSGTCQGYTPVPSMTFTGTIFNKGNDTGSGQWTRSDGISGSLSLETNLVLTPTGELLQSAGWGQTLTTELNVIQSLIDTTSYDPPDPNSNEFQGRQVYETGTGSGSDACWNAANASVGQPPFPQLQITGSVWNVGAASGYSSNAYGYDTIGYDPHSVSWYRTNAPGVLPCTTTLNQTMMIVDQIPGFGDDQFATHTIQVTLGPNYVTVTKDNVSQTLNQ